ncbi:putative phosphoesterase [Cotonvirus japonicus]|uniref:Phosphoesterase n=1 Tax=Cotonvirus japonicus TaxID=2811091 RepID=A0ABM7NSS5_9VIRU|nr:putative phosphoesterase [Cotonvirus japonicus]BCS83161.1 putative phosphoesterase [Cotonvirus japonicus]
MTVKRSYRINNKIFSNEDFIKDCPNHDFLPTILPPVPRIIAIGDIHGDLNLAINSFKLAKLIDDNHNWIASPPDTIVVQVGDQIDSCRPIPGVSDCHNNRHSNDKSDDINVMIFFDKMHEKASQMGGAVYSLLGNHELMNSQNNFNYVSHDNYHKFNYNDDQGHIYTGPTGRKNAFKPGGPIANMMACKRQSTIIIGSTLFTHAGVLPVLAKKLDKFNFDGPTQLKYLNSIVRKWLLNKLSNENDVEFKTLIVDDTQKISPFWTRIYGSIPNNVDLNSDHCFDSVKKTIEVFKIGQIVVGHTPQLFTNKEGINGTCYGTDGNHKLYRIDGGFSDSFKYFNDKDIIQVLEILDDKYFRILTNYNSSDSTKFNDF